MDLNKVPAKLKADALRVGVLFGSPTVLDEVERSLQAQDKHAALLGDGGYTAADRLYVVQARDALKATLAQRVEIVEDRVDSFEVLRKLRLDGKEARRDGRDVLGLVSDDLAMSDDPGAATAAERVEAALNKTQRSGADLTLLADQLDALSTVAALPLVAGLLDGRGEQGLAARLSSLAAALRQGAQDAPRLKGAHTESEQINLLDGLLILKLRRIRDIARRIARKRAQPALANDFSFAYL